MVVYRTKAGDKFTAMALAYQRLMTVSLIISQLLQLLIKGKCTLCITQLHVIIEVYFIRLLIFRR